MKLDKVKYARCDCGKSYPLAHCIIGTKTGSGKTRPDNFIAHKNVACVPCLRKAKMKIERASKGRPTTAEESAKWRMLVDALPTGL